MRPSGSSHLTAVLLLSLALLVCSTRAQACCRAISWQPECGSLSLAGAGQYVALAPIGQTLATTPWRSDQWYVTVQELRVADGQPYDVALVRLDTATDTITGQSGLVNALDSSGGLSVFQSFATALRAGTTNVQFHFENATLPVWINTVHLHRTISTDLKVSARLELYSAADDSLLYQRQWLWDTTLVSNVITHSIPVDSVHGPVSRMRLSFWGSGYAAVALVNVCQQCVSATPTPTQTPSNTAPVTITPSAPPVVGHACQTGARGVCAAGTWQQNDAGSMVCVMATLPSREICDGLDNDCDGLVDEDFVGRVIECGAGICYRSLPMCLPSGALAQCTPGVAEPVERCDGLDNDCNGLVDDALPTLSCGIGACYREVPSCVNATLQQCVPGEPQPEQCDGVDNDCDGVIDEGATCAQSNYALAQPLVLPLLRCVNSNAGLCTAYWDVVATSDEPTDQVTWTSFTLDDQDDDWSTAIAVTTTLQNTNTTATYTSTLGNGQREYYWTRVWSAPFTCASSLSWLLSAAAAAADFQQVSQADRYAVECSDSDNLALAQPFAVQTWTSASTNAGALLPVFDGCVQRLDGYCVATLGYYYANTQSRLDVPIGTGTNYVSSSSGDGGRASTLTQAQPTRFYPGRVARALVVRVECPTASLQQWWLQWRLGNAVARATSYDICTSQLAS